MAMASINIPAMTNLASALDTASSELPYDQYGLRTILGGVDVDASPASGIGNVAAWVEAQIPGVQRRLALARAIEAGKPGLQNTVQIDESKISSLDPAAAEQLGAEAAKELKDSNGDVDQALIDELAQYQNDPYFAAGFAKNISASELANVVTGASNRKLGLESYAGTTEYQQKLDDWKKKYGELLTAMGGTLATATSNTGSLALPPGYADDWVKTITAEPPSSGGDARWGQAEALSLLLHYGSYGTNFLDTVSTGVYDYERSSDESGMWHNRSWADGNFYGVYAPDGSEVSDPLAGIMTGLSHNAVAAQDFFDGGGDVEKISVDGHDVYVNSRLKYLIQDRTWASDIGSDNGDGLGAALEAASTYLRDNTGTGYVSAKIAGETFALIGEKTGDGKSDGFLGIGSHQGWKMWDGLRPHVANMIASYAPDLMRIAGRDDSTSDDLTNGFAVPSDGVFPPGGPWGAAMNRDDIEKILGTLGEDQKNIDIVLAGVGAAGKMRMDYALQQALIGQPDAPVLMITNDKSVPLVNGAAEEMSGTFAFVIDSGFQGDKDNQEFQKQRAEDLSKALGMVLAMPTFEIPEGHEWTSAIIDQAKDVALDSIGEGPDQDAQSTYNSKAATAQTNLTHVMLNELLQSGYFDGKYYDQAGAGYRPPPADALIHNPDGTVEFDFDNSNGNNAYADWAREGQDLNEWMNTNVVVPFRSRFPALGEG